MGLECHCGVKADAESFARHAKFHGQHYTVKGCLTYHANVCVSALDNALLVVDFEDEQTEGAKYSFIFTATKVSCVECCNNSHACEVTVSGMGTVNGKEYPFVAVFYDTDERTKVDFVKRFTISGFFDQNGLLAVKKGSIRALGCE
ncbi:hypothetical protein QWT69_07960 [Sporosarcina oncorhynchi]|uniref:Uncharacterized protein n=1 Tax=Sporosarcina oncorhynchi TaxID=3056444 RepID=A0ABZ0LAA1_9BACL|nr:hypothetical protein [Sporosarcina sp. T2O-4]WOV89028.1 hypothetical protein QWT69_07960 [Sporosarcina sp. T2O-4]